ncbi:MAG TPA: cytochrome b/b6 domain-containing protein [Methylomirabilota bacterium]|nr:cytochrome b/b6 domain-containing protein [Methylomirabilota bacterium]
MRTILRFTATERTLHWSCAVGYLALLASGLPLMFPALRSFIRDYTPVIGVRLHVACAILWCGATLAVILLGNRRRLAATCRELTALAPGDLAWMLRFPRWIAAGTAERARLDGAVARFNAGQKVNALFTVVTSALLLLTGIALIPLERGPLIAALAGPGGVAPLAWAHRKLTLLVLLPLATHVLLALVFPPTRPSLTGMVRGSVDRAWAAAHHPRWCPHERPRSGDEAA